MLLLTGSTVSTGSTSSSIRVEPGELRVLEVDDPAAVLADVAGLTASSAVGVVLDEHVLTAAPAARRWSCGLATTTCRVPAALEGTVLELLLLGERSTGAPRLLSLAAGTGRARASLADAEAAARAFAGRIGLARWLAAPVQGVPEHVVALAELARCLHVAPTALIIRDPDWLADADRWRIHAVLDEGRRRLDAAVVLLRAMPTEDPGSPGDHR